MRSARSLLDQVPNPFYGEIPPSSPLGQPTITRQQLLRPYPRFQTVALYRNNVGHSTFHSFQARVEKRFSRGLTFGAAYTFSRLIDDAGAVFDSAILTGPVAAFQAADSYNRRLEKDVSTGNIPHAFAASFIWEFARGWQLAGIARVQSGSPVAVTQQPNLNAFAGFGIQRPNLLRDPSLASDARSTARWFDTSAFAAAPQFTIGNASRNPVVGPGYQTLDLMIGKTFPITERVRLELRAEAFNSLNTPPLGNPNGTLVRRLSVLSPRRSTRACSRWSANSGSECNYRRLQSRLQVAKLSEERGSDMSGEMEYKGYVGSAEFSTEDEYSKASWWAFGDLVTYEATTVGELKAGFHDAVDDYIRTCQETGRTGRTFRIGRSTGVLRTCVSRVPHGRVPAKGRAESHRWHNVHSSAKR